ncbi:MAG: hypothetical protein WC359_12475 [Dehalococcoidia bacterium]|jgi:hypothetical protein
MAENIDIVGILRKVPEKHLLIIELANSIPVVNGSFDALVLAERQLEIKMAADEAAAYGTNTLNATNLLLSLLKEQDKGD